MFDDMGHDTGQRMVIIFQRVLFLPINEGMSFNNSSQWTRRKIVFSFPKEVLQLNTSVHKNARSIMACFSKF